MHPIQTLIEESFEKRADITPATASPELKSAVMQVIDELDNGRIRVADGDAQPDELRLGVVPRPAAQGFRSLEIGAVVVWRVKDTAQALFDVEHYESYVATQTESAIRTTAAKHPYDAPTEGEVSLRGDSHEVNAELMAQLTERLSHAGVEILEVRLSHLAYAPEIAGVMLRRQQAEAILDARARIVEGAVSMVKMALDDLHEKKVVALDEPQKAALVSNLLVVLCSENDAQPVVSTGA